MLVLEILWILKLGFTNIFYMNQFCKLVLLAFSLIYFCNLIIFLQGANDYLIGRNNANEIDLNR